MMMPPAWTLTSILLFIHGVVLGSSMIAMFGDNVVRDFGSDFVGGLIGGALGAIASVIVWVLSYWHSLEQEKKSKLALRKALWNDVCSIKDTAYREAEWWRREMADNRFGATEDRLFSHMQSAVLESNLNRITDIPVNAADALLAMRANLLAVRDAHEVFYKYEDKIIDAVQSKVLSVEKGTAQILANKQKTFYGLCKVAMSARYASRVLDVGNVFELERQKTFSPEQWAIRSRQDEEMNATLDQMQNSNNAGG